MNEQEMSGMTAPSPDTISELAEFIGSVVDQEHDYGTCVYAMSLAAVATFNYVAHKLGVTGFQASMADLDIIRRTRYMKGPFMIVNGENVVYPQYDLVGDVAKAVGEWTATYGREEAQRLLAVTEEGHADSRVIAHWRYLAALPEPVSTDQDG